MKIHYEHIPKLNAHFVLKQREGSKKTFCRCETAFMKLNL